MPTCHWCHVMERESFEDLEVASILNQNFISIKVDREERQDIDTVYMNVCQALTGSGGWPLTVIMSPDKKPFFAGTYFPKHQRYGQTGLIGILNSVAEKWRSEKERLTELGNTISEEIARLNISDFGAGAGIDGKAVENAIMSLSKHFDREYGGFGAAPKFPSPHNLLFLMHCHSRGLKGDTLKMVEKTLKSMYRGGIFDHAGYGFSRYSTDSRWLVPHFEKMLYDNALLVIAYSEAYQITKKPLYRYVAEKTLEYVRREMTHEGGGFYSAQDADSDGEEGKYYTWEYKEIEKLLGEEQARLLCKKYGVSERGNFEGKSILNRIHDSSDELPDKKTEELFGILRLEREKRHKLHKDDKLLTAWNAMMTAAYAKAGRVFENKNYIETAEKALKFLNTHMTDEGGRPKVSFRNGRAGGKGLLDDYAYLSWACLELYESTFDPGYLKQTCDLINTVKEQFSDENGGFFLSPSDGEKLIYRPKEFYDGAVPSGNSVLAYCTGKLSKLIGEPHFEEIAENQLKAFSNLFYSHPTACTFALKALAGEVYPGNELVCMIRDTAFIPEIKRALNGLYMPWLTVHMVTEENREELKKLVPFLSVYDMPQTEKAMFYLCQGKSCFAPEAEISIILEKLSSMSNSAP